MIKYQSEIPMNATFIVKRHGSNRQATPWRQSGIAAWACCGALLVAGPVFGADYFVANSGNNTNSGLSADSPWELISRALSQATDNDTIHIAEGDYRERVVISNAVTLLGANIHVPANPPFARLISRTVIRPPDITLGSAVVFVKAGGATVRYLTLSGDYDTNGLPDAMVGIYSTNRPLTVDHCIVTNVAGYGILNIASLPPPAASDTDSLRSYFGYNTIVDIIGESEETATGIFLDRVQATCEFNDIGSINGVNARAGIYLFHTYYTSHMADPITVANNYFEDCLVGLWANKFGYSGETIDISNNTVVDGLIGIRISASKGPALVANNTIAVSGISPSSYATPARGLWIQADFDPWGVQNTSNAANHLVVGNSITGGSTNADGTVGILLEYDSLIDSGVSNGVRATVISNFVGNFDYGIRINGGTAGATVLHDPMVEAVFHYNNIYSNQSYCMFASGVTQNVNAVSNWWGSYLGPTTNVPTLRSISTNITVGFWPLGRFMVDTDGDGLADDIDTDDDGDALTDLDELNIWHTAPDRADTDGDGISDWAEIWTTGTDPTNPLSVFMITTSKHLPASGFWISWSSATNRNYKVYASTNLLSGFPTLLTNVAGTPPTNSFLDTNLTLDHRFYRVNVTTN